MTLGNSGGPDAASTGRNSTSGLYFSSLSSSSLPSLGVNRMQPSWRRSIAELAAESQSLIGKHPSQIPPQPSTEAQLLLGTRTDFSVLGPTGTIGPRRDGGKSSNGLKSALSIEGGIEQTLRNHRDEILTKVVTKERKETRKRLNAAVNKQLEEDWEMERAWWKNELTGNRNLVDRTNTFGWKRTVTGIASSNGSRSLTGNLLVADYGTTSLVGLNGTAATSIDGCNPRAIQEHLTIVRQMQPPMDPLQAIAAFEKVALSAQANAGYQTAWQFMTCMLPKMSNPVEAALGSLVQLSRQYQTIIRNRVRIAQLNGNDASTSIRYGNGMAATIASYVQLTSGSSSGFWEIVYYCLRCGDATAAKSVLDVSTTGNDKLLEQPVLSHVLDQIGRRQGGTSCVFEIGVPMVVAQDREALRNFYEKAKNMDSSDHFKIDVLALLCGQQMASFSTIEDYLFGRLWLALQDHENPVSRITEIGSSIRRYGPEYFGSDDSGGWAYALPLIASQQFKSALTYLAGAGRANGLQQAVHLGLVLAMAGVEVADLEDTTGGATVEKSSSDDFVCSLLVSYSTLLEREPSAGVLVALQYLLKIPNRQTSIREIAALVFRSPSEIEVLGGSLNEVGERRNAELDKHLSDQEVSVILSCAADMFKRQASDIGKAELSASLYMRAYRHATLINFLNQLISPVNVADPEREHWASQSQLFYNSYLSKRTLVLESLERERRLDLIFTNQTLLELRAFFKRLREGMFEEAFAIVSRTELLPFSQDHLNDMSSKFKELDSILKEAFPAVVTGTVQCLFEMHRRLKSESHGVSPTVEARLKELQFSARVLFIFAGLINMPTTCKDDILGLKANMI